MKKYALFIATALIILNVAHAGSRGENLIKVGEKDNSSSSELLRTLNSQMVDKIVEVEAHLSRDEISQALTKSKAILDDVRLKTGIHPKKKLKEKFHIPTKFREEASQMIELGVSTQELIIETIASYRGGLFLDIINLSKRVSLLYIKAFQKTIEESSQFFEEDRKKIIKDLAKASLFPIQIQDKNKKIMTIFAEDVSHEDHTYLFNRELKIFLIENKKLQLDEEGFNEFKNEMKDYYHKINKPLNKKTKISTGINCIKRAKRLEYAGSRNEAGKSCFKKYYKSTRNPDQCFKLARSLEYKGSRNEAGKKCTQKFR